MRRASIALLAGLTFAAPTVAFADVARQLAAVEATPAPARAPAPAQDVSNYAQREQASPQAGEFEGGQVVVVFSGAALVALIVLLLLI